MTVKPSFHQRGRSFVGRNSARLARLFRHEASMSVSFTCRRRHGATRAIVSLCPDLALERQKGELEHTLTTEDRVDKKKSVQVTRSRCTQVIEITPVFPLQPPYFYFQHLLGWICAEWICVLFQARSTVAALLQMLDAYHL